MYHSSPGTSCYHPIIEDTARYAGLLLTPAESFGQGFFALRANKSAYYAVLAHFWQFLVPSSNLGNFKKNKKSKKKIQKVKKEYKKKSEKPKKSQKKYKKSEKPKKSQKKYKKSPPKKSGKSMNDCDVIQVTDPK